MFDGLVSKVRQNMAHTNNARTYARTHASQVNGRSRRNLFYAGLGRLACGDFEGAKEMFSTASSDDKCNNASVSERDVAATLMEQAKRGLDYCARLTEPA